MYKNAPPMHSNCHCATAPHYDSKSFYEWLDARQSGKTTIGLNDWKKRGNSSLLLKLDLQTFAKKIKPLQMSSYEKVTVPSAMMVYARAQPKEDTYNGRMMIKEYGDYRYHFIWYNEKKVVIYKRTKIRARNRS